MKRIKKIIVVLMLLLALYFVGFIPLEYNVSYEGIKYRNYNSDFSEKINIQLIGTRLNKLYKSDEFYGKIIIDGVEYSKIKIKPDKDNQEILTGFVQEIGEFETLGAIFTNSNLTEFCIQWFEVSDGEKFWSSVDGLIY
ncbi:hypothetical protein SAMN02745751_02972 [Dethiosulfatibacter aminovorans DSM 17477]|uniref:Uncharacterized protein n=1 Tax=Dethiosulfatibacter aminovorans DSM 17477 TaxID=1121476 RepID=A0A1M6KT53_9FIRM|nr:hypothetical protein [Dethiosulfatibacter aminovorans]SHJ62076.1 hypothetical protein SAMN02745751_02972 [Dethiosulfatibacter aminovorans DSM 17477]